MTTPPFEALEFLANRFAAAGIHFALGGSGLLAHLGLVDEVRDWDITTDAKWETMEPHLAGLDYERVEARGIFATAYLCRVRLLNASVDVMGDFALQTPEGVHPVPTRITGVWKGIPMGCPVAWEKAYRLMGRTEKAELLGSWNLAQGGSTVRSSP